MSFDINIFVIFIDGKITSTVNGTVSDLVSTFIIKGHAKFQLQVSGG